MKYSIKEIADINRNSLKKEELKKIVYLDTANLTKNEINELVDYDTKTDKVPSRAKRKVEDNDILISTVRPNQEHYGILKNTPDNLIVSTGFAVITPKSDLVDPYYLYAVLTQKKITNYLQVVAENSTSAYPSIKPSVIANLEIDLLTLNKQKSIGKFFKSLEYKIELNNQIISNLEELASTLFKRWFVDFEFPDENGNPYKSSGGKMVDSELGEIPEGWELRTLGYFSEIIMGQSPKGESYNNDNNGLPLLNGASDFKNGIISPLKYTTEPKKVTQKGDFIFGVRATVGHVTESDGIYAIGRGTGLARTKNYYAKEFLYFSLKNIIRYLELTASGSIYVNISKKELNDFKLIYPANRILQLFHRTTVNLFKEKMNKYIENQFLTELRDSLLSKLLSGEIELPEDEEV